MASQADVDSILSAIAGGAQEVRFADGRRVVYRSVGEMQTALGVIRQELNSASTIDAQRTTLADLDRGL